MTEDDKKRFDYLKGWLENADVSFVMPTIHELQARIESLSAELERERQQRVQTFSRLQDYGNERDRALYRAEASEARVAELTAKVEQAAKHQFEMMKSMEAGTLHSGHCSASRDSMVGSDGCCCVHGEPYRRIRALEEALREIVNRCEKFEQEHMPIIRAALEENRRG